MIRIFCILFLLIDLKVYCTDTTKVCVASRIASAPKIDGTLNESFWTGIHAVSDFIMNRPIEGGSPTQRTEVKIAYDNKAVYVGAMLFDTHPDSILHELGNRDDGLNADYFRFVIDPYNLRQDAFDFGVYASGVQTDAKFTDVTFNAVWESAVKINSQGWSVEMRIPYSAIRFPKKDIQEWAFQATRNIRRNHEFDQWTLTPSTAANGLVYWGRLTGIENIQTPPRLSVTPYASAYFERAPDYSSATEYHYSNSFSYNVGADLKYGIDDRFTLDMTLLPDFGQTQSDNKVKNLSYREITYNENRSFFKEGTDLFSKNALFYSRRIGKTPTFFYSVLDSLQEGESIEENPSQAKLINAFKISGRSNSGLGFGLFNAVTNNMYAELQGKSGVVRKVLTEPLTNYNVLVLDQQVNDFSNFYFINTNVTRDKKYTNANVTGTGFTFADKKNRWATDGSFALSQILEKNPSDPNVFSTTFGHKYFIGARKISGKYQFGISRTFTGSTYNQLDMGYYTVPNYQNTRGYFTFLWFKPWKKWLEGNMNFSVDYSENPQTKKQTFFQLAIDGYANRVSYNSYFFGGGYTPLRGYDYNEPRIPGRFHKTFKIWYAYAGFSTDYRKKFAVDFNVNPSNFIGRFVGEGYVISTTLRYRFNDKFTLRLTNSYNYDPYNLGVADYSNPDTIIYGLRIMNTYENVLSGKYIFKNDMALTLNARHYWTTGNYRKYLTLLENGDLVDNHVYSINNDFNYNVFNIDFVYSWQFAPGSNLSIVYKNAIETQTDKITSGLFDDFKRTVREPQSNSISIKILYYLDYLSVKRKSHA
ncbi:MAG TPA: DUF5916 domain-containing protein [Bacteroidia bacterium]|nr:DUF5916 domain-containing protein [Bacteroidia bacterium]